MVDASREASQINGWMVQSFTVSMYDFCVKTLFFYKEINTQKEENEIFGGISEDFAGKFY